ncbi:hypothetical protein [Streptomyces hokutonensis]|uniref:hypothetical protein n=1 Tax=Streptomyces hokutonensis TaxID=1306990 RepID=UPI0036C6C466
MADDSDALAGGVFELSAEIGLAGGVRQASPHPMLKMQSDAWAASEVWTLGVIAQFLAWSAGRLYGGR